MMKKRIIEPAAVIWIEHTLVGPLRIGTSEKGISFISFADPDDRWRRWLRFDIHP